MPALSEIVERHPDLTVREHAVRQLATTQGRELAALGINLNFSPVVDVNHQVKNPHDRFTRIFQRAISSDPAVVTQVAGWYCDALEETGVQCTLKHFPGLGRVFDDTHASSATLTASAAELTKTDWLPFRTLMTESRAFTMLSHVRLTSIDAERPVSISPLVISGLLREDWRYDGVLITDDFSMSAVYRSGIGIENGSIDALNAGVDLILISWDTDQYYRVMYALLQADRKGVVGPGSPGAERSAVGACKQGFTLQCAQHLRGERRSKEVGFVSSTPCARLLCSGCFPASMASWLEQQAAGHSLDCGSHSHLCPGHGCYL